MDQVLAFITTPNYNYVRNVAFKQTDLEKNPFDDIKSVVARDTILSYQYFNKQFNIHTDARNFQLCAVIIQNRKPIAFIDINEQKRKHDTP